MKIIGMKTPDKTPEWSYGNTNSNAYDQRYVNDNGCS
jgi:hypothetical protein